MLLDGALRFGRQAAQLWDAPDQRSECSRLLRRAIDIAEELVASVSGRASAISKRLEEEYAFAFRQLAFAQLNRDRGSLESALRLLAIERDTWKLAVEKLRQEGDSPAGQPAPAAPAPAPFGRLAAAGGSSLSLQG